MKQYRKGDRFEVLKKGEDTSGSKVSKGSIVVMYDMSLGCNPPPSNSFYLKIKGVTTEGQMIDWHLDNRYIKKIM